MAEEDTTTIIHNNQIRDETLPNVLVAERRVLYKKHCRAPSHLVKCYEEIKNRQPQGNFMELCDDLTQFADIVPPPETHAIIIEADKKNVDGLAQCIVDSGTSHSILRGSKFLSRLIPSSRPTTIVTGQEHVEQGHGPASIYYTPGEQPRGTIILHIKSAIYAPKTTRKLISFQDIRANNLHIHTSKNDDKEDCTYFSHPHASGSTN